jgi:hypothetical protein
VNVGELPIGRAGAAIFFNDRIVRRSGRMGNPGRKRSAKRRQQRARSEYTDELTAFQFNPQFRVSSFESQVLSFELRALNYAMTRLERLNFCHWFFGNLPGDWSMKPLGTRGNV